MAYGEKTPRRKKSRFLRFLGRHTGLRVFLIAFGCCVVVLGALAVYMIFSMASTTSSAGGPSSSVAPLSIPTYSSSSKVVLYSDADSFNLLLASYDDSQQSAGSANSVPNGQPASLSLIRLDAKYNRIVLWQVPLEQSVRHQGATMSAGADFRQNGIGTAAADLGRQYGIAIQYTCSVPFSQMSSVLNSFGGLQYPVPASMSYTENDLSVHQVSSGTQLLTGDGMIAMLGTLTYGSNSVDKYNMQAALMKTFLQSKFSGSYLDNASTVYGPALSDTLTNFSVSDITSRLKTIRRITSQQGDYIKIIQPTYIPQMENDTSLFEIDSTSEGLFTTYLHAKF